MQKEIEAAVSLLNEPILCTTAPIAEAQLVESRLSEPLESCRARRIVRLPFRMRYESSPKKLTRRNLV